MKIEDLRKKTSGELGELLNTDREKIRDLRFKLASRQLKDVRLLRKIKREVAIILTVLAQNKRQGSREEINKN